MIPVFRRFDALISNTLLDASFGELVGQLLIGQVSAFFALGSFKVLGQRAFEGAAFVFEIGNRAGFDTFWAFLHWFGRFANFAFLAFPPFSASGALANVKQSRRFPTGVSVRERALSKDASFDRIAGSLGSFSLAH